MAKRGSTKAKSETTVLDRRIEFATKHVRTHDDQPFSLEGRDWVVEEFWKPLHSFRYWPVDTDYLCNRCAEKAGSLTQTWDDSSNTRNNTHALEAKCRGLVTEPILLIVLNLPRRSGKTFNTGALVQALMYQEKNQFITLIASSDEQAEALFSENYEKPIRNSKRLNAAASIVGNEIRVKRTGSFFEHLPSTHSAVTGRGRSVVVIDEARDVKARTAAALLPSINEFGGWECPTGARGHTRTENGTHDPDRPENCVVCNKPLQPWFGRILIMSSAGILEDSEKDWFAQLVDELQQEPDRNAWLYVTSENINPRIQKKTHGMVERVFSRVDAMKTYIDVEATNVFRRKGEDFLTKAQIDQVVDNSLANRNRGSKPCVGFLDTSITQELTSLVILEDDSLEMEPDFTRVRTAHIKVWDPKQLPGGIIDAEEVEEHLDLVVPGFPLLVLGVDTRANNVAWAKKKALHWYQNKPWGRIVESVTWGTAERNASWGLLERHVLGLTISIQAHAILRRELRAARSVKNRKGVWEVRDASRKILHLDVAESLAGCCYYAHLQTLEDGPRAKLSTLVAGGQSLTDRFRKASKQKNITSGFKGAGSY